MKKIFTLLTLMLATLSASALDSGTEKSGNTGTNNTTLTGTSYSLDGKYIAGGGSVKQGDMPDKGVKLRSNQGNLVFAVAVGYKITGFRFYAAGNTSTEVTIESATVDGGTNLLAGNVVIPAKGAKTSGNVILSGIAAKENITLTFASGSSAQIVGTWEIDYEQTEVVTKEISEVKLNGVLLTDAQLATLKSTKALEVDGSSFNGIGALEVTLSAGATSVTRTIADDGTATFTFAIDSDNYTVTVTGLAKTYEAALGSVVAFDETGNSFTTADGIKLQMVAADKEFQTGSSTVTLGGETFTSLKLSTGSAVNVTLPAGKVATKIVVYGWSANGNGFLSALQETSDAEGKKVEAVSNDIFYSENTAADIYPSVYSYTLDNWESIYFSAGGSKSQPFIVFDIVLTTSTGITSVAVAEQNGVIYNLAGQAVGAGFKGIAIRNGKKVVIK